VTHLLETGTDLLYPASLRVYLNKDYQKLHSYSSRRL